MDTFHETREAMERAIRRLSALEYLILAGALVFAMAGGALVAFLLSVSLELPFRPVWILSSILLFLIPGAVALGREARNNAARETSAETRNSMDEPDGR